MADTPFGLSFGNPSRYMGQSPLAEIGKAAKTGLMIYGLEKSGIRQKLDDWGIEISQQGNASVKKQTPAGAVPPIAQGTQGTSPAMQGGFGGPVVPPQATQQVAPVSPATPEGVVVTPIPEIGISQPPADAGSKILDGTYQNQSSVDVKNPTDFNPVAMQDDEQKRLTGNEYQQVPGYGKLAKIASSMFGMG